MSKQLHVNLFEMNCVSHIVHGLWVQPDNNRHRFNDIDYWLELAQLLEHGLFDGVFLSFDTARDFIELAVPELQRRGRFREAYNDGETLRERLFGPGHARLPNDHIAARYRDPAALHTPVPPLRFPAPSALAAAG